MNDLFLSLNLTESFGSGGVLFRQKVVEVEDKFYQAIRVIADDVPFQYYKTRSGVMSVAMTGCGKVSWVSDQSAGYRYSDRQIQTGKAWPAIPSLFLEWASLCAEEAGYSHFIPDSCLINRYQIGAQMGLHQDKDEKDLQAPIVSLSFGIPANFLFGGVSKKDPIDHLILNSGDVFVFGGKARLAYHGIARIKKNLHPLFGAYRYNLTFRKVL